MIGIDVTLYPAPSAEITLPRNPIPPLKRECPGLFTSVLSQVRWLPIAQDRFSRPKNSPYTADECAFRWRNRGRNTAKNAPSVTTAHVFRPNQPRKATSVLPIWLRNSDFPCRACNEAVSQGGGGGQPTRSRRNSCTDKVARNFLHK